MDFKSTSKTSDKSKSIGNAEGNTTNSFQNVSKIIESMEMIEKRIKGEQLLNAIVAIMTVVFLLIFDVAAIFAIINSFGIPTILFAAIAAIFTIVILNSVVIYTIRQKFIYKNVKRYGYPIFAKNYKLVTRRNRNSHRRYLSLEYEYIDGSGFKREGIEVYVKVSRSFFEIYSVDKLPIKAWDKYAIVDYEALLKYQDQK